MAEHIDYDKESENRYAAVNKTGGMAQGGLTVRDYFAARAMATLIAKVDYEEWADLSKASYALADAMMGERAK